ncbi:MAG: hypothetical protein HZB39_04430 [Planctomycetes bacterium]|nr:hypothetical protein [Planctomycetota bacterium]
MRSHSAIFPALFLCTALTAQVPISGSVYDGAGGPLLAGTVYHTTGSINVPLGQTLTMQPGAVVKLAVHTFTIDGTLLCQGTAGSPCVITSIHDDTAGGDTNGNGNATSGGVNQWYGMSFGAGSGASALTHTQIRFMGWGNWSVSVAGANPSFVDCRISDGGFGGLSLTAGAMPTVTRCDFQRINSVPAAHGLSFEAAARFTDTTASNCPGGAFLRVDNATLGADATLGPRNGINGVLVYNALAIVSGGTRLTLEAGLALKASAALTFVVNGTLIANGTVSQPVVLTSIHDDSVGGDTNQNGTATSAGVNQWYGMSFRGGSSASVLTHAQVRCMGWGNWSVEVAGANPTFVDCRFSDGGFGGLVLASAALPTVTRCDFQRINSVPAVHGMTFDAAARFTDTTASNCPGGAYLRVDNATPAASTVLGPRNGIQGVLVYAGNPVVPAGITLTLQAGLGLKALNAHTMVVNGTLVASGTAANRVVLTSIHDDSVGGDTNQNGNATAAGINQWYGVSFRLGSSASSLTYTDIRCTGWGNWNCASVDDANPSFDHCRFSDGGFGGLAVSTTSRPTVANCDFQRIASVPAMYGFVFDALAGLSRNTASNCSGGNYLRLDSAAPVASCTVRPENVIGGVLVYNANPVIPTGVTLTLEPGLVLKANAARTFVVAGNLIVNGPVVFTSFHDDAFGGDTNGNGNASAAGPNQWYGIRIDATSIALVDLALVRCSGWGNWAGITCNSGNASLRRCRVEFGGFGGFDLSAAFVASDLVAFANGGDGITLRGGGFDLLRATSAYNGSVGVRRLAAWSGNVRSSIAHGNPTGGFAGFAAGQIDFSDGSGIPGGSGNLNVDPLFLSAGAGDLRLSPASPCIDAGDPLDGPTGLDGLGFPRLLDGNVDGAMRVDMGAYEFDNLLLLVTGSSSPGGTLTVTSIASPQLPIVALALGLPFGAGLPVLNFGGLFVDPSGPFDAILWPANGSAPIPIPSTLVGPIPFAFQLIGFGNPFPRGNTSNPYFFTIE